MKKVFHSWGALFLPWIILVLVTVLTSACQDSQVEPTLEAGSWYVTGYRWPHVRNPFGNATFNVFSDGASQEARQLLAGIAALPPARGLLHEPAPEESTSFRNSIRPCT